MIKCRTFTYRNKTIGTKHMTKYIISKMSTTSRGTRLFWNGSEFAPTYQQAGIIGMTPAFVTLAEYIKLRLAAPVMFHSTGLLNKRESCVKSISTCDALYMTAFRKINHSE